ncbi:hypothetical protein AtNW77_Chr2g0256931 [Arabidopsis thaliana]
MNSGCFISLVYERLTTNMEMIIPYSKSPDLPPHASINAYSQRENPTILLVPESHGVERSDRDLRRREDGRSRFRCWSFGCVKRLLSETLR